jgi:N-methylhydantoinase B
MSERRKIAPYGLKGGSPGSVGEDFLVRNGKRAKLPGKAEVLLKKGDVLSIRTPGGGGWGKGRK